MKDERNVRNHRAEGARWRPAALLLAAVLIAVSVPFFGKSVFADDLDPVDVSLPCSLTVDSSGIEMQDKQNVVVDLYRVAYLTPYEGYDTYRWELTSAFPDLPKDYLPEYTDRDGWKEKTEELASLILGTAPQNQTQWNPTEGGGRADDGSFKDISEYSGQSEDQPDSTSYKITGVNLGKPVENIPSGFYVIIARGSNITEYVSTHESDASDPEYMTSTVTLATSEKYTYQFAAEMVAVPTKIIEDGEANTANTVPWQYNPTVVLKPEIRGRGGTLAIVKNLDLYEYRKKEVGDNPRDIKDNATFVFEVTAYENERSYEANATPIYHNFVTITYNDESGSKTALVEDLPVGAFVVVQEVYSGRSYTGTVEEQTAVINPNEQAQVDFKNTYDKRQGGGGSFVNNFKYVEYDDNTTGWDANRVDDNSTESEVVTPFISSK